MATKKPTPEDQAAGKVDLKSLHAAARDGATDQALSAAPQGGGGAADATDLKNAADGKAGADSSQAADPTAQGHDSTAAAEDGQSAAAATDGGPVTSGGGASNGIFPDISDVTRAFSSVGLEKRRYLVGSVPVRHEGEVYSVGEPILLTEKQAKHLDGLVFSSPEDSKE